MKLRLIALVLPFIALTAFAEGASDPCGILMERMAALAFVDPKDAQELWQNYARILRAERKSQLERGDSAHPPKKLLLWTPEADVWTYETGRTHGDAAVDHDFEEQGRLRDRLVAIDSYLESPDAAARAIPNRNAALTYLGTPDFHRPLPEARPGIPRRRCFKVVRHFALAAVCLAGAFISDQAYTTPIATNVRAKMIERAQLGLLSLQDVANAKNEILQAHFPLVAFSLVAAVFLESGWRMMGGRRNISAVARELRQFLRGEPELPVVRAFTAAYLDGRLRNEATTALFDLLENPPAQPEPVRYYHLGFSFLDGQQMDLLLESRRLEKNRRQWRGSVIAWPGPPLAE